jgi:Zn-dependent protease
MDECLRQVRHTLRDPLAPPPAVTFPLLFVMGLLAEATRYDWDGAAVGWAALMYGPILLLTVAIHELGHSLAARHVGGQAEGILLWPLGGLAYVAHTCGPKGALP